MPWEVLGLFKVSTRVDSAQDDALNVIWKLLFLPLHCSTVLDRVVESLQHHMWANFAFCITNGFLDRLYYLVWAKQSILTTWERTFSSFELLLEDSVWPDSHAGDIDVGKVVYQNVEDVRWGLAKLEDKHWVLARFGLIWELVTKDGNTRHIPRKPKWSLDQAKQQRSELVLLEGIGTGLLTRVKSLEGLLCAVEYNVSNFLSLLLFFDFAPEQLYEFSSLASIGRD